MDGYRHGFRRFGRARRSNSCGNPLGRVALPADIAALVGFLVTDGAGYLSGNTIDANGASYLR